MQFAFNQNPDSVSSSSPKTHAKSPMTTIELTGHKESLATAPQRVIFGYYCSGGAAIQCPEVS